MESQSQKQQPEPETEPKDSDMEHRHLNWYVNRLSETPTLRIFQALDSVNAKSCLGCCLKLPIWPSGERISDFGEHIASSIAYSVLYLKGNNYRLLRVSSLMAHS